MSSECCGHVNIANPNVRLSAADVQVIRQRHQDGATQTALGLAYGVRQGHISRIVRGVSWEE